MAVSGASARSTQPFRLDTKHGIYRDQIIGAIELRDLLTQLIDALTEQGVIIPETPLPTIVTPPGRPH
jgi:hypothetical protein